MTNEKYFDDARELFMCEGWKTFIAEIQAAVDNCRIENIQDEKAFRQVKGELDALHRILGYENLTKHLEDQHES